MVHFVKSSIETYDNNDDQLAQSLFNIWEINFVSGLESLLVECAVINDDIERDCFISRVYCWFTEKLSERRDVPRSRATLDDLRSNVQHITNENTHTLRGLNTFDTADTVENRIKQDGLNDPVYQVCTLYHEPFTINNNHITF